ncbi:hypothetical protein TNCV_3507431 [Trichonephila clavipes]|uniref:Uncharacterized protein n=1 Tax=Trichonephila clavipes TaxID=2585209 RepID=A0A8X6S137_TRICX|nr:hypothetical protein TNCV_3507431 [Trichonephila clavipes]
MPQYDCRGSLVVKVMDSWLACREYEPCTAEEQSWRRSRCRLNMSKLKRPPVGVVYKLGEECYLRCSPRRILGVKEVRCQKPSCS